MEYEEPEKYKVGKPVLSALNCSTQLIGSESSKILRYSKLEHLLKGENKEEFDEFKLAERNIWLIQDFIHSYKAEDMKRNALHVARDNKSNISSHP